MPRSRMRGAIPPLPPYTFMAWCSVKAQGQLYLLPFSFTSLRNSEWKRICHNERNTSRRAVFGKRVWSEHSDGHGFLNCIIKPLILKFRNVGNTIPPPPRYLFGTPQIWKSCTSYKPCCKGKRKVVPVFFNSAPRHEGVLEEWKYNSTHSLTSALDRRK
jgi:hypothetical protein